MSFLMGPKPSAPPKPPEQANKAELEAAAAAERKRLALAQGRASTILTGGMGDTSAAPTASARLMGS